MIVIVPYPLNIGKQLDIKLYALVSWRIYLFSCCLRKSYFMYMQRDFIQLTILQSIDEPLVRCQPLVLSYLT